MKLKQLEDICLIKQHGLNISSAAREMNANAQSLCRSLGHLEDEIGFLIFYRDDNNKRLTGVTPRGMKVLYLSINILGLIDNMRAVRKLVN